MIDISGIDKATLVAALFNNSKPVGGGFLEPLNNTPMTQADAQKYLDNHQVKFDYLEGRYMKIDVSTDSIDPERYDRVNGIGEANSVVEAIRNLQVVNFKESIPTDDFEEENFNEMKYNALLLAEQNRAPAPEPAQQDNINYSFLSDIFALPASDVAGALLLAAGCLALGLMSAGVLSITMGTILAGVGLFSGGALLAAPRLNLPEPLLDGSIFNSMKL